MGIINVLNVVNFIPQLRQFNASRATLWERFSILCIPAPQPQIHPQAQKAAVATEAAGHKVSLADVEILLEHQQELGNGYLAEYAIV